MEVMKNVGQGTNCQVEDTGQQWMLLQHPELGRVVYIEEWYSGHPEGYEISAENKELTLEEADFLCTEISELWDVAAPEIEKPSHGEAIVICQ